VAPAIAVRFRRVPRDEGQGAAVLLSPTGEVGEPTAAGPAINAGAVVADGQATSLPASTITSVVARVLSAEPMRATGVKRAWNFSPVTCMVSPGPGPDCSSGSFSQLPGHVALRKGSCWSARSRVAARTNELDADERRGIIGGEEESFPVWLYGGSCAVPGGVAGGVVSQAPIRRPRQWGRRGAMTMCPGTGLLGQKIEPGRWPAHAAGASSPGLGDPPGLGGVMVVLTAPGAGLPRRRAGGRRG
jgi:hypothetical protein